MYEKQTYKNKNKKTAVTEALNISVNVIIIAASGLIGL